MNEMFTFYEPGKRNPLETVPTTYAGQFHAPFIDSVSFQRQQGEICAPTSFRVVLNSQGIQKAYGIPLQENNRMVNIFHAHGLIEVERNGAFISQVFDMTEHYPELKKEVDVKKLSLPKYTAMDDVRKKTWIRDLIDGRSILTSVKAKQFYKDAPVAKEIHPDEEHAIALLGIDIPSPSEMEERKPRFWVFDPNTAEPEWRDADEIFACLSKDSMHLSFGKAERAA